MTVFWFVSAFLEWCSYLSPVSHPFYSNSIAFSWDYKWPLPGHHASSSCNKHILRSQAPLIKSMDGMARKKWKLFKPEVPKYRSLSVTSALFVEFFIQPYLHDNIMKCTLLVSKVLGRTLKSGTLTNLRTPL